jgi:hypothetical protein
LLLAIFFLCCLIYVVCIRAGSVIGGWLTDTHLLKLQRLQNKVLRTTRKFPRRIPVRELHTAFQVPYTYDYTTKLCRQQAEVIQNHENANVRGI